jgi:hypothetical protein
MSPWSMASVITGRRSEESGSAGYWAVCGPHRGSCQHGLTMVYDPEASLP